MGKLIDFYTNKTQTPEGLKLEDMWNFNDWELEHTSKFIQWMFPLELVSNHNNDAPVATESDINEFKRNKNAVQNLKKSLNVMENFLGFKVNHANMTSERPKDFRTFEDKDWITPYNHNFIRLTRVIHSLVIFGMDKEANELVNYLNKEVYCTHRHQIGDEIMSSWENALNRRIKAT